MSILQITVAQGASRDVQALTQSEFFIFSIPFLLTFAIVYGILSNANIPDEKNAQTVLALISGLLVMPVAPQLMGFLTNIATSLSLMLGAFLVLIIMFELLGTGHKTKGVQVVEEDAYHLNRYARPFGALLIIIASVIFVNSGGLELLGIQTPTFFLNAPIMFFFLTMAIVVYFVALRE